MIMAILRQFKKFTNPLIVRIRAFQTYLKQNECQKYQGCLLLHKLLAQQPAGADRYLEYPWMLESIQISSGKLLDVGSTASGMLSDLLPQTIEIYAIDLNERAVKNSRVKFAKGDIRKAPYPDNYFDCVTCISTLEHIGVSGRYGSDEDTEGDIRAMREIKRTLKKNGLLLVTVPYGIRDVLPINRLYNQGRLAKIFDGFRVQERKFLKFNNKYNLWLKATEEEAAKTDMIRDGWYAIALIRAVKN